MHFKHLKYKTELHMKDTNKMEKERKVVWRTSDTLITTHHLDNHRARIMEERKEIR